MLCCFALLSRCTVEMKNTLLCLSPCPRHFSVLLYSSYPRISLMHYMLSSFLSISPSPYWFFLPFTPPALLSSFSLNFLYTYFWLNCKKKKKQTQIYLLWCIQYIIRVCVFVLYCKCFVSQHFISFPSSLLPVMTSCSNCPNHASKSEIFAVLVVTSQA